MSGEQLPTLHNQASVVHSTLSSSDTHILKDSNVKVVCRVKPLGSSEEPIDMRIDRQAAEISIPQPRQETTKTFTFNRIFTQETQDEFVREVCDPVIEKALFEEQGYLIFSYGVTNSGKTHTILGTYSEPGILPYLVRRLSECEKVYLSAIELYNDEFFSLVNKEKLTPRELNGFLDFSQCDIQEMINEDNMEQKIKQYVNNRTQNETKLNSKSSRSHAIFRIKAGNVTIGVVDLAGSERTNRVFASVDETSNINKSLLCLGRCIKALNENPDSHLPIPYRESKLTKVLIEYFAAKVEVLMIANINQSLACFHENMKVLDYAVLAKDIRHCTTENSLRKNASRMATNKKTNIFDSLYKNDSRSASKQTYAANKTLMSSRSKIKERPPKSNIKKDENNEDLLKEVRAKQLQTCIDKFDSSQSTMQYMDNLMHKREVQMDNKMLQMIKNTQYYSPVPQNPKRKSRKWKQLDFGVEEKDNFQRRQAFIALLEKQRIQRMEHKETSIGESFSKFCNRTQDENRFIEPELTPQKSKKVASQQENFIVGTSSAIYSSVKKIISEKVHKLRQIIPSFKKMPPAPAKANRLAMHNYGYLYEQLFSITQQSGEESKTRFSEISFNQKIVPPVDKPKECSSSQINVDNIGLTEACNNKPSQQIFTDTDDDYDYPSLQIQSQTEISVINNTIVDTSPSKQNVPINQADDEESKNSEKKPNHEDSDKQSLKVTPQKSIKPKRGKKQVKNIKERVKELNRVAEMRQYAARLCRDQSRTPLKKRLRNYHK